MRSRFFDGSGFRLVGGHLRDTLRQRRVRRISSALRFQRRGVALEIGASQGLDFLDRNVHLLGVLEHLREQICAKRKLVVGVPALGYQVVLESVHGLRRSRIRLGQLLLQIGVADGSKRRRRFLGIELSEAAELRDAQLDVGPRHGRFQIVPDLARHLGMARAYLM